MKAWQEIKSQIRIFSKALGPFKPRLIPLLGIILLAAMLEGVGFSLIFPLLQILTDESRAVGKAHFFLSSIRFLSKHEQIFLTCALILTIVAIKNIILLARIWFTSKFVNDLRFHWQKEILGRYLSVSYCDIIFSRQGALINNLIKETDTAACSVKPVIEIVAASCFVLGLFGALLWVNWALTLLIFVSIFTVILLISKYSFKSSQQSGVEQLKLVQDSASMVAENLDAIQQIKAFSLEKARLSQFVQTAEKLKRVIIKSDLIGQLPNLITEITFIITFILLLAYLIFMDRMPFALIVSTLGVFAVLSQRIFLLGSKIGSNRVYMLLGFPSVKLMSELQDLKSESEGIKNGYAIRTFEGKISFQDVQFGYRPGHLIFKELSFEIEVGNITAISGKSGVGKTTLINLLLGFFDQYTGQIFINDIELRQIDLSSFRKRIGLVSQEPFLFYGSIRENIAIGKARAMEEEIVRAAKVANAHQFIETFPEGYKTNVAERGLSLSVGQRQRIAIARAIIRQPDLFIFDEPTSALDSESELLICDAIKKISKNRTSILISHRPSTLLAADRVFILHDGIISKKKTNPEQAVISL